MEGTYRNWSRLNLERVSEDEYITKADVYVLKDETSAFVSVRYSNGVILSSEIVTRVPYMMGVAAKEIVRSRLVYDVDMGVDDWLISSDCGGDGEISIKEGANGIEGVTMWSWLWRPSYAVIAENSGVRCYVHTVNDRETAEALLQSGVSAVYTDYLVLHED